MDPNEILSQADKYMFEAFKAQKLDLSIDECQFLTGALALYKVVLESNESNLSQSSVQEVEEQCRICVVRTEEIMGEKNKLIPDIPESSSDSKNVVNVVYQSEVKDSSKTLDPKHPMGKNDTKNEILPIPPTSVIKKRMIANVKVLKGLLSLIEGHQMQGNYVPDPYLLQFSSVLFFGLPGNGKSLLVHRLADSLGYDLITISSADIMNAYVGGSEERLLKVFEDAFKSTKKTILFFDEIDLLFRSREQKIESVDESLLQIFMNQMDRVQNQKEVKVFVMSGTNKPKSLDKAVARRYDYKIQIKGPNEQDRKILIQHLSKPSKLDKEELAMLARKSDGSSCKEIEQMIRDVIRKNFMDDLKSNFFKKDRDDEFHFVSCMPNDPGAVQKSYKELPKNSLRAKPIKFKDLLDRFANPIKGYIESDVQELESFEKMYGSTALFE